MSTNMKLHLGMATTMDEALSNQTQIESPITTLAMRFCFTLSTPTTSRACEEEEVEEECDNSEIDENEKVENLTEECKTFATTAITADEETSKNDEDKKADDNNDEEGIISNTFTINSAGISPATRQREQQARGIRARKKMAPQLVNFDIKCDSPGKENVGEEDISFYSSHSPAASPRHLCPTSPSSIYAAIDKRNVMSFNSQDSASLDSGFGSGQNSNSRLSSATSSTSAFDFIKPCPPENFISTSPASSHHHHHRTPSKYTMTSNGSSRMGNGFKVFHSLSSSSMDSCDPDDEFMELMEMENMDEDAQMPTDLKSLICKDIKSSSRTPDNKRPSFVRKCLDLDNSSSGGGSGVKNSLYFGSPQTPKSCTITSLITTPERQCLGVINENITNFGYRNSTSGGFKRPDPPSGNQSPMQFKRLKCDNELSVSPLMPLTFSPQHHLPHSATQQPSAQPKRHIFRKSVSLNDAAIMNALSRSSSEPNLIGDCSLPFCLPLIDGRHNDLKSIDSSTMRSLLLGEYNDRIASYKIIDCRYPYEFEGGHIRGAINLYTQEQIIDHLVKVKTEAPIITAGDQKRHILIFHCEFSSERGPKLSRFLRNHDRTKNENSYPALHYPEIYLLHNGYKEFFEMNSDLCTPETYRPMNDPDYMEECKQFRAKSKSFGGDGRGPGTVRFTKSRSRLVL